MKHETYAEINLNNLAYNIHAIQQRVSPSQVIPIVKADAYSQGAVPVTKRLASEWNFFQLVLYYPFNLFWNHFSREKTRA